jgi:hypothetical protein
MSETVSKYFNNVALFLINFSHIPYVWLSKIKTIIKHENE